MFELSKWSSSIERRKHFCRGWGFGVVDLISYFIYVGGNTTMKILYSSIDTSFLHSFRKASQWHNHIQSKYVLCHDERNWTVRCNYRPVIEILTCILFVNARTAIMFVNLFKTFGYIIFIPDPSWPLRI